MTASVKTRPVLKHPVDQVPPVPKLALYGLQHVMAYQLVAGQTKCAGDQDRHQHRAV